MKTAYERFLDAKLHSQSQGGFEPKWMPDTTFPFQHFLIDWALMQGRGAIYADCGLGKSLMELVWAENVVQKTNRPVLLLTPLAVGAQMVAEGEKFEIECKRSREGEIWKGINVTNYERLHYFNPSDFAGVVCDESSILKSFDGERRKQITAFMRNIPYRLLATATAAPNDYTELGTSSEALGLLGYTDMLTRFFKNDNNTIDTRGRWKGFGAPHSFNRQHWRFKGHAEEPFWRWVTSWARALRKPSDFDYEDGEFILPPLNEVEHVVEARTLAPGALFSLPAVNLQEQREERRRTIKERCDKVASLVDTKQPALVWCHLNSEGDMLERAIPDCVQISGNDSDEEKEEKFLSFVSGETRVLVTKPKISAWGLNFQHCAHVVSFPSHSFEQYYQGVRRCWRFGQKRPVTVDIVTTEGEREVLQNLQRKQAAADKMFERLVEHMSHSLRIRTGMVFPEQERIPSWLS